MSELDLFAAAVAIPDPTQRAAYLNRECAHDLVLRQRLQQLLNAHFRSHELLDQLPPEPAPNPTASFAPDVTAGALIVGRYKLLQQIGEGGMGAVWMADQIEPVKRRVAVKLIRVERGQSKMILSRFEAERQAIALMDHPNIAKLLDAGVTQGEPGGVSPGSPFFVMELVKGKPLTDYCDEHRLGIPERLALFTQVCSAVQHAHQKGVIHRDLKPTNILVESHDGKPVPKVIDFGLAKATHGLQLTEHTLFTAFGNVMGTPLYMAPEQATFNAVDVDTRADVYALGVILYELLTGATPLTRESVKKAQLDELFRLIRDQEARTPSSRVSTSDSAPSIAANRQMEPQKLGRFLRGELDWIVLKALSKERDRRYETALGFARDIDRFLHHEPVAAGPPTAGYRVRKFVQRNRGKVMAAGLVALTLVFGVAGTAWGLVSARQSAAAEKRANEQTQKRLAQIEKGVELFAGMLSGINPKAEKEGGEPLFVQLRKKAARAAEQLDAEAVGDALAVARLQTVLGNTLRELGDPVKAIKVLEKAHETQQRQLGADHAATLECRCNLASAYQEAGQSDNAVSLFEATLKGYETTLGADHPDTLICRNNLAVAYYGAGRLDKALPHLEATLKGREAKLGAVHPDTLNARNNLAMAYRAAGQSAKALQFLEAALKNSEARLGADHASTLATRNNLAAAYQDAKQFDKALPLYEETLKGREAKLGADHPDTLTTRNNLATAYAAAGRLDKALPLFEATLIAQEAKLGADHPNTLNSRHNLAWAYRVTGQLDKALPLSEVTLKGREAKLGRDHPHTVISRSNLASAYLAAGRLDEALPLFEQSAAEIVKRQFQQENAYVLVGDAINAFEKAGQLDKAEAWRRKRLERIRDKAGPSSPAYAAELSGLGQNLLQQKKWSDADPILRECLSIRENKQPDAWAMFSTQSMLGGALMGEKKYKDAEPLLLMGYEGLKSRDKTIPPQAAPRIPEALDRLIDLYTATNKPAEVAKWKAERAKVPPPAANPKSSK